MAIPTLDSIPKTGRMRLRTWNLRVRRVEDFALEYGGEEALFQRICEFIAGGGMVTALCAEYAIDLGVLMAWIRADVERNRRYEAAVADRKLWQAEQPVGLWQDVVAMEPAGLPSYGEVLKASELLAKHTGVLRDGPGQVSVHVGGNSLIAILTALDAGEQDQAAGAMREPIEGQCETLPAGADHALEAQQPRTISAAPPDDTGCETDLPAPPPAANPPATASAAPPPARHVVDESLLV